MPVDFFVETAQPWWCRTSPRSSGTTSSTTRAAFPGRAAEALFDDLRLHDLRRRSPCHVRADVAKTITRRRKGTVPMLEELARDVTGWPAHVSSSSSSRLDPAREPPRAAGGWADLLLAGARGPDRRAVRRDRRTRSTSARPRRSRAGTASPPSASSSGACAPTARARARASRRTAPGATTRACSGTPGAALLALAPGGRRGGARDRAARPGPIRPETFHADLEGDGRPLWPAGRDRGEPPPRPQRDARCALADQVPAARSLALGAAVRQGDRRSTSRRAGSPSGRASERPRASTSPYHYGFSADLGGGPYDRRRWLVRTEAKRSPRGPRERRTTPRGVASAASSPRSPTGPPRDRPTRHDRDDPRTAAGTSCPALRSAAQRPAAGAGGAERRAARSSRRTTRPTTRLDGQGPACPAEAAGPRRRAHPLRRRPRGLGARDRRPGPAPILHSTVVPGRIFQADGLPKDAGPSCTRVGFRAGAPINEQLRVEIAYSDHGLCLLQSTPPASGCSTRSSTAWAASPCVGPFRGGATRPSRARSSSSARPLGRTRRSLDARDSIFDGEVLSGASRQAACARLRPPGSHTPRRIRCQPDLAVEAALASASARAAAGRDRDRRPSGPRSKRALAVVHLAPLRAARIRAARIGTPCRARGRRGGRLGAGAFSHLKQPQRRATCGSGSTSTCRSGSSPG